ncbi:mast cell protease 1A-like [Leguminivora glycinivorella]|uniref:mast cell protease 1A-like n=1 Tax=Leguminivora glycinivorella TaxID=1035111 RepID=UPI00200F0D61|nr:mast cell protease 1A-like [Leguminivora glycinivorella]
MYIMFKMLFITIFCMIVVNLNEARGHSPLRVYKGRPDLRNEFPFVVLFQLKKPPYFRSCTGSLISETLVLTAEHCLSPVHIRTNIVRYGEFTLPGNETKLYSEILKVFLPKAETIDIGIALVQKISKPRAKLLAIDYKTLYGLPAKYAGFGRTLSDIYGTSLEERYRMSSVPLQVGEGMIVPCPKSVIPSYRVCVVSKCSDRWQATRQGDSGGPLVYNGDIVGVVHGAVLYPTISYEFCMISSYLEWIQGVMRFNGYKI